MKGTRRSMIEVQGEGRFGGHQRARDSIAFPILVLEKGVGIPWI